MAKPVSVSRKPRTPKSDHPVSEAHHLNDQQQNAFNKDATKWDSEDKSDTFRRRAKMDSLTEHLGCTSYFSQMRWTWFGWNPYGVWRAFDVSRYYQEKKLALDIGVNQSADQIAEKKKLLESNGITYHVITSAYDLKNFAELNI